MKKKKKKKKQKKAKLSVDIGKYNWVVFSKHMTQTN